jgi:hypothetical protein
MKSLFCAASTVALMASAPAFAGTIDYTNFKNTDGLTLAGQAATSGGELVLTPANANVAGAALTSAALALGATPNFTTSFQFTIDPGATPRTGNGFAFVLTSSATGVGSQSGSLGLTTAPSLAVEFSDYGNPSQNPMIGKNLYNSNLVAAISNGNTIVAGNPTGSYGSPGPTSCVGAQTSGNGCMNNGDIWTADISYVAGKLSVSLEDGAGGFISIVSGYAIALGSNIYAGFSGSTGSSTDSVNILNWSMSYNAVPEPMTVGLFGIGLAAVGFLRSRPRAAQGASANRAV